MQPAADLSLAQRIDSVCDRFEADWKAGRRQPVETYLTDVKPADREALQAALLAVQEELAKQVPSAETSLSQDSVRTGAYQPGSDDIIGGRLGRFEILALLGQGAFGKVYKARDPQLERDVAIKVPKLEAFGGQFDLNRFLREAKSAAAIQHPNICPVHEVGSEGGQPYIVMALVPGKSLAEYLKGRDKPLPQKQAALIVRKLALALHAAHEKRVVHRDLKPANILFDPERKDVVITDFGLAIRASGDARQTHSGVLLGTPAYMSPEQARGDVKNVGPASDIFALGVILYEMLTGRRPFEGSLGEVLGQVQHVEPPSVRSLNPAIDERLDAVCRQAMAKAPSERFASMKALAAALEAYLKDHATAPTPSKQTDAPEPEQSVGLAQILGALSADRRAETEAAVEAAVHKSRIPLWKLLAPAGLLGVLLTLGIIFFARTPTATVMIHIDVDLNDKTLSFFLDGKAIAADDLKAPIELKVGNHELLVKRGEEVVRRFTFTVSRDAGPRIELREEKPEPPPKQAPPPATPKDADRAAAEWVLGLGGSVQIGQEGKAPWEVTRLADLPSSPFHVQRVGLGGRPIKDADFKPLEGLQRLVGINLLDAPATDRALESLAKVPRLEWLQLDGTQVTDEGVKHLAQLQRLQTLHLNRTAVTGTGFAGWRGSAVRTLHVDDNVTDAGVKEIAGLTELRELSVSGWHLTEDGVKWLRSLKLEYLSVSAPPATDKIVEPLVEMKQLTHLGLGAGRLTDEGLKRLSAMRQLKFLGLGGTAITSEGLAHLRPMPLTALSFWPRTPQISDAGLKHLQELKTLRSLNLTGTSVTDAGIPELARMTWLTHIHLNETKVTAAGLRQLQQALPGCTIEPAPPADL
jgi:serine/threonine protein kinase